MKKIFLLLLINFFFLFVSAQPTPSSNVGIGTTTPTRAKIEVHGAVDATSAIFGGESSGISLQRNWPGIGFNSYFNNGHRYLSNGYAVHQFVDPGTGYLAFDMFSNGVAGGLPPITKRAMVLTNNGRMTIGSADFPPATLYVARGTGIDGTAAFQGTIYRSHFNYAGVEDTYIRGGINGSRVILNDIPGGTVSVGNGTGLLGINTNLPEATLEVRQAQYNGFEKGILLRSSVNNTWEFYNTGTQLFFKHNNALRSSISWVNGDYNSVSDARLKTGIESLEPVINKIMLLRPVKYQYNWQHNKDKISTGFLAQEVKNIFPHLVSVTSDKAGDNNISDLHLLNYSGFAVLAIKAIQEQQILITDQQNQIDELKELIKTLLQKIKHIIE